jgi:hypothetical protein
MRHGPRHTGNFSLGFLFLVVFTLVITLSACNFATNPTSTAEQSSTSSPTSTTSASTGGSTPTPTQPPIPVTNCSQVSGFGSAVSISAGLHFSEVNFQANTIGFIAQKFETNSYQFEIINACTKSTTVGAIHSYYASGLPSSGFAQSSTYPYNGNASAACGDPYCWFNASSHPSFQAGRYVSLESVTAHGSVVTYSLRLSIAPIVRTGIVIQGTYHYDFDLVSNTDVWWEQVTSTIRKMAPENGATVANIGVTNFANVTYAQLKGKSYSTSPLDGNDDSSNQLVNGDVWAVHTDLGAYVKVLVTSYGHDMTVTYVWYEYTFINLA